MDQLTNISDKIVELVEKSQDRTMLGVRLGAALRASFRTFSPAQFQCKNLRQFIKKHVPGVVEEGYSGADVLYRLAAADEIRPAETSVTPASKEEDRLISLPTDLVAWKAYTNPSYPLNVAANALTGEIKAIGLNDSLQAPWVAIPKVSSETQRNIAGQFVGGLQEPAQGILKGILAQAQWYVSFFGTAKRLNVSREWGLFKREHLIRLFTEELRKNNIVAASPAAPKHDIRAVKFNSRKSYESKRLNGGEVQIRELVSRLAFSLPIDELRGLRVPNGALIDVLNQ